MSRTILTGRADVVLQIAQGGRGGGVRRHRWRQLWPPVYVRLQIWAVKNSSTRVAAFGVGGKTAG
jgi:hypothetical protein